MREPAHALSPAALRSPHRRPRSSVRAARARRQRGAIGVMLAVGLPVLLGFLGLALEMAQLYNRKAEMQSVADAIAIAAAKSLNGTQSGVDNALAAAHDVVENGYDWTRQRYEYEHTMVFSEAALKFGKSADGSAGWIDAASARSAPQGIAYVKVDTSALDAAYGKVDLLLMPVLASVSSLQVAHVTVAGRQTLKLTPLAICAMSADPSHPNQERKNPGYSELSEYGFRRGVSYNLMQLSPTSATPLNYLVDPISLPPRTGTFSTSIVGQYVCTGTVELPKVIGQSVNLQGDFPIAQLFNQLNARFDASNGQCSANSAPPDANIKSFAFGANSWMAKPNGQVAEAAATASRLQTIADLAPPDDQTPARFGPLWVFARAVPWSAYTAGQAEPAAGYVPFAATSAVWKSLYSTGPTLNSYPSGPTGLQSPYFTQVTAPSTHPPGVQFRRVLNIPLLQCPVSGTTGTVVAVGHFFMTVPADASGIYAEFAGATVQEEIAGAVELYQ